MNKSIFYILLLSLSLNSAIAQTDSVSITGKIANLTPRLYRQAPYIVFSRNNILQPQTELSRQVQLQADGSFRLSLPLIFKEEEFYLDYGGRVFTSFLGSKGNVDIRFDADSLTTSSNLFKFGGVNAAANNQYPAFLQSDKKIVDSKGPYGTEFYPELWQKDPSSALSSVNRRADARWEDFLSRNPVASPQLKKWVRAAIFDEAKSSILEYVLNNNFSFGNNPAMTDSVSSFLAAPLTLRKIEWVSRFAPYAGSVVASKRTANSRPQALPATTFASLIRDYVKPLSADERERLDIIVTNGSFERSDLDFLNSLYRRNRPVMESLVNYEKSRSTYAGFFNANVADFLSAWDLVQDSYKLDIETQGILYNYARKKIKLPEIRLSLDEAYRMDVQDSLNVRVVTKRTDLGRDPKEVLPGIWISQSAEDGLGWVNYLQNVFAGKSIYLIKWSMDSDVSREQLATLPAIQAQVPENVVFLYVHIPQEDSPVTQQLWKQYIVKKRLRGVHMYLTESQFMSALPRLNPFSIPSYTIIRPNGKYYTRNAASPVEGAKVVDQLLKSLR